MTFKSMKLILIIAGLITSGILLFAIPSETPPDLTAEQEVIQWHQIQDLSALASKGDKNIVLDIYTDWCSWCKVMDNKTFSDTDLASYLNQHYYMVKFDAETKDAIQFKGKDYPFVKAGKRGHHSLARVLCQERLSYPAFVVLDQDLNIKQVIRGFQDAAQFKAKLQQTI